MQHFLLSPDVRTITIRQVYAMGEDAAHTLFCQMRWKETNGAAVCPRCGSEHVYPIRKRRRFKCANADCMFQFSVTTGTSFANHKLPFSDLLAAMVIFASAAKGVAAIKLAHDLGRHYRTAWLLAQKLREAAASEQKGRKLGGIVEIDGAGFGGYVKPHNVKSERVDRRLVEHRRPRKTVVIMRERDGLSYAMVAESEAASIPEVRRHLADGAIVYADEGTGWNALEWSNEMGRVNHSIQYYDKGVCTNQAESYFSRLRRAEVGIHHSISDDYLDLYAREHVWREDHKRLDNRSKVLRLVDASMKLPVSERFTKYCTRNAA